MFWDGYVSRTLTMLTSDRNIGSDSAMMAWQWAYDPLAKSGMGTITTTRDSGVLIRSEQPAQPDNHQ